MAVYLKFGKIDGDATQDGHVKWIDINSVQFGSGRSVYTPVGSAQKREASNASVSEVTCTKTMDAASTNLMTESLTKTKGSEAKIYFTQTGEGGAEIYLKLTLKDALVSGYSTSSGGDRPSESFSLNFTDIEYSYAPQNEDGTLGDPIIVGFDVATGKSR